MAEPSSTSEFSDPDTDSKPKPIPQPTASKVNQNFIERTRWTILMLVAFVLIMGAGQIYCCLLVLLMNLLVFKEVSSIKRDVERESSIPLTPFVNWYFYIVLNWYCLGATVLSRFPWIPFQHPALSFLFNYHTFITFCALMLGFVAFVISLKQGYLRYQFRLFGMMVLASVMVCLQSWLGIQTILKQGMFWFVVPALLIICNDIFAYLVGYFFGHTKLISISPKKTWEGFVGGAIFTVLFSFVLTSAMATIPGFMCPMQIPSLTPFSYPECQSQALANNIFTIHFLGFDVTEAHLHVFVLAIFASTIGPFGGFFASGLKRAMKIKDFADFIPGHGGVSDRMDCQIMMCSFVYFYLSAFMGQGKLEFGFFLAQLTRPQQLELQKELLKVLAVSS